MTAKSKKVLGIDYGDFTIGLAIFDEKTDFIYPYKTILRERANILRNSIREIIELIDKEKITHVVIGYPLNFDGTEGERVEKVKNFADMLSKKIKLNQLPITINFQDERLTTKEAKDILSLRGIKKSEQKKFLDQVAAEIILSDYRQKEKLWTKQNKIS